MLWLVSLDCTHDTIDGNTGEFPQLTIYGFPPSVETELVLRGIWRSGGVLLSTATNHQILSKETISLTAKQLS